MCRECDYRKLLEKADLGYTPNRFRVLEVIGKTRRPVSAREIFAALKRSRPIDRVTVYRILDRLVEHQLVNRISGGGRTFFYGLAPNEHHAPHPHFYCKNCGHMACLNPGILKVEVDPLRRSLPGTIEGVEVRIDGICKSCLKNACKAGS